LERCQWRGNRDRRDGLVPAPPVGAVAELDLTGATPRDDCELQLTCQSPRCCQAEGGRPSSAVFDRESCAANSREPFRHLIWMVSAASVTARFGGESGAYPAPFRRA
jgi:hypothetical protein